MGIKIESYKRTKILATLGPATNNPQAIADLMQAGVNGFRLNFSHGDTESRLQQIDWIRTASRTAKKPVAILQDLQGPKIRLGEIDPMEVKKGDVLQLGYIGDQADGVIPVQYDLSKKVKTGQRLYIFDGKVRTEVVSVKNGIVAVEVQNSGWLMSRKGINLPDTDLAGDILTDKDRADIRWGVEHDIDYVALSFVQTADDVKKLRSFMKGCKSPARIIAKIETVAAVKNIEAITREADGVMVARGDLAVEAEPEIVPIAQRRIIGLCQEYAKLSIVATQMLGSMTDNPEPTRAEVSDVATATILGADCLMLSEETASGDYPVESVAFMKRVITYTESNSPLEAVFYKNNEDSSIEGALSSAVMSLAHQVKAKAIVVETASGASARNVAAKRPNAPIIMVTGESRVAQQLALIYGGKSYVRKASEDAGEKMTAWLTEHGIVKPGDTVVVTSGKYPGKVGGTDTIKVRKIG